MFKIQFISVLGFFLFFAINLNGHPSPRGPEPALKTGAGIPTQDGRYKEYIEYVDEDVEEGGDGPDERYEIINAEDIDPSIGLANEPNAQVVDDVDLDQFDQNGNFIGAAVSNSQAQQIYDSTQPEQQIEIKRIPAPPEAQADLNDQEYYEDEEEIDLSKQNSDNQEISMNSQKPRGEKTTQHLSRTPKKDPYKVIEEKYPGIFDQLKKSNKEKKANDERLDKSNTDKPRSTKAKIDNNQETEYEYIEDEPEVIYDSGITSDMPVQHMDSAVDQTDTPIQNMNDSVQHKDSSTEQTDSPIQHMDIHPAMSAQNPLTIQQVSGPKDSEPGAVQITQQKLENQTITTNNAPSQTIHSQAKYQDTVLKPQRQARILARYKVVIPVIVPNLRIRVPYDRKRSTK